MSTASKRTRRGDPALKYLSNLERSLDRLESKRTGSYSKKVVSAQLRSIADNIAAIDKNLESVPNMLTTEQQERLNACRSRYNELLQFFEKDLRDERGGQDGDASSDRQRKTIDPLKSVEKKATELLNSIKTRLDGRDYRRSAHACSMLQRSMRTVHVHLETLKKADYDAAKLKTLTDRATLYDNLLRAGKQPEKTADNGSKNSRVVAASSSTSAGQQTPRRGRSAGAPPANAGNQD